MCIAGAKSFLIDQVLIGLLLTPIVKIKQLTKYVSTYVVGDEKGALTSEDGILWVLLMQMVFEWEWMQICAILSPHRSVRCISLTWVAQDRYLIFSTLNGRISQPYGKTEPNATNDTCFRECLFKKINFVMHSSFVYKYPHSPCTNIHQHAPLMVWLMILFLKMKYEIHFIIHFILA